MTFPGTRSRRRWRGSWAATASLGLVFLALVFLFLGACSSEPPAAAGGTPSSTATASPSASPAPTASSDEVPVSKQVLPPATDPPAVNLCSKPVVATTDGNVIPLQCSSGALNVRAWTFYSSISASVLALGLNPTEGQVQSAMCDDIAHNHATRAEEPSGYRLARSYYGWSFNLDPTQVTCQ